MGAGRDLIFTILGIDKSGSETLDKVGKHADHAADRLDHFGNVSAAALGGTVGAAAAAGVGIAAALGGTAVAIGAFGLVAAASNEQVSASYTDLWADIKRGTRDAAQPLTKDLLQISDQVGSTFAHLQPQLRGLFTDSMPAVHALTDGVLGLVTEALPGLDVAIRHSAVPAQGFRDLMISTGKGASEFFTNISAGSESSGAIIRDFGGIIRSALGFAGTLFAKLSNEGAPAVHHLGENFDQLLGVVDRLASGALPIMFGAANTGMTVLSGLLSVVSGLSGVLGPLTGVAISAGAGLKLLDTITFGNVTGQLGKFKAAVGDAEGIGGKLKAGLTGLVTRMGPVGIAAGALGIVLHELGEKQEEAARRAAEHKSDIEGLTKALVESKGVVTDQIAQDRIRTAQTAGIFQETDRLGIAHSKVTLALLGNRDAYNEVSKAFDAAQLGNKGNVTGQLADKMGVAMAHVGDTSSKANQTFHDLADAMFASQDAAAGVADKQNEAADATRQHAAAVQHLHELLLGYVDKNLGYRMAIEAEKEAHEKATEAIKKHGAKSDEATQANFQWEQSITRAVSAAGELAAAKYKGSDASELARLKTDAEQKAVLQLALAAGNTAPPALRQLIAGMDGATIAALGMSVTTDKAGNSVVKLPNGKTITLTADDKATATILGVSNEISGLRDKTVTLRVIERRITLQDERFGTLGRAGGGPVRVGQPYIVGEQGPELIFPQADGWVATASETRQMMSGGGYQPVGGGPAGSVVLGLERGGSQLEDVLLEVLRKRIRVLGGNVQVVLGR